MIKRIPVLIFASLLLLTGCSNDQNQNQKNTTTIEKQQDTDDLDTTDEFKDEITDNQEEIKEDNEEQLEDNIEDKSLNQLSKFKIYTSNEASDEVVEVFVDNIDYNNPIKDNLQELSNMLVKEHFKDDSIKINVVSIDENNIATVDLLNEENWLKYFQGSTGGALTQEILTETLLQDDYDGEWISGVKILVDGEENKEYDHISFAEIFER